MYLNDYDIYTECMENQMIQPFNPDKLQPGSYDCTLDNTLIYHTTGKTFDLNSRPLIHPGEFLLASTLERVKIPSDIVCQVWGKSSNAREGLFIHTTAGWVDPGFEGQLTMELYNCSRKPFDLRKIKGICQLTFARMNEAAFETYHGGYQNQNGATRSYLNGAKNE